MILDLNPFSDLDVHNVAETIITLVSSQEEKKKCLTRSPVFEKEKKYFKEIFLHSAQKICLPN